jgi:hypothetical protein
MIDPFDSLRAELVRAAAVAAGARNPADSARRRWWPGWLRRRSHPLLIIGATLVIAGSAAAAVVSLTTSRSQPLAGRVPGTIEAASLAGYRYTIAVTPNLDAGQAFWNSSITYSKGSTEGYGQGGGGGGYATASNPLFGGTVNAFSFSYPDPTRRGDTVGYVLTSPQVAAVRIGKRTIATFTSSQLPAGDRAAVVFLPPRSPLLVSWVSGQPIWSYLRFPAVPGFRGPHKVPTLAVLPLDTHGEVIPSKPSAQYGSLSRFWQAPSAVTPTIHEQPYHGPTHPLPGVCELAQRGLTALRPEWGHSVSSIGLAVNSVGELFLSCVDIEYYLHGWPLQVGVLLDARQPGRVLGAIPGSRPLAGDPNIVNFDAGRLSARRQGDAWLVVQGGANAAQRVQVLQALSISKLDLHHISRASALY